ALVRFKRGDDRVAGVVKVLGRVAVGRAVAAADMTTCHTEAQMDPARAGLEALFAPLSGAGRDRGEAVDVRTGHELPPGCRTGRDGIAHDIPAGQAGRVGGACELLRTVFANVFVITPRGAVSLLANRGTPPPFRAMNAMK